jgi:hypothetical protein
MSSLHIGQTVNVDLFGLQLPGVSAGQSQAKATVVALGPGVITVRVDLIDRPREVTISPGRVRD